MTTPKCPLCRGNLEMVQVYAYESIDSPGCLKCGYQILNDQHIESAKKNSLTSDSFSQTDTESAERFISLFPPVMQVQPGDHVEIRHERELYAVLYTDADKGTLYLQNCRGIGYSFDVSEIRKWPWELKQEGRTDEN